MVLRRGTGVLIIMHGRSRKTIDPRIPTMPGRSTSGFNWWGGLVVGTEHVGIWKMRGFVLISAVDPRTRYGFRLRALDLQLRVRISLIPSCWYCFHIVSLPLSTNITIRAYKLRAPIMMGWARKRKSRVQTSKLLRGKVLIVMMTKHVV